MFPMQTFTLEDDLSESKFLSTLHDQKIRNIQHYIKLKNNVFNNLRIIILINDNVNNNNKHDDDNNIYYTSTLYQKNHSIMRHSLNVMQHQFSQLSPRQYVTALCLSVMCKFFSLHWKRHPNKLLLFFEKPIPIHSTFRQPLKLKQAYAKSNYEYTNKRHIWHMLENPNGLTQLR